MTQDNQVREEVMDLWEAQQNSTYQRVAGMKQSETRWRIFSFGLLGILMLGAAYVIYVWGFQVEDDIPISQREIIGLFGPVGPGIEGGGYYFKFNGGIYWVTPAPKNDIRKIKEVDFETFRFLSKKYQVDKDNVYFEGAVIKDADPETFEPMDWPYARDKNRVYYHTISEFQEVDPSTFEVLLGGYQKDKDHVYFQREIIEGADPASFEVMGSGYARDKNHFYRRDQIAGQSEQE